MMSDTCGIRPPYQGLKYCVERTQGVALRYNRPPFQGLEYCMERTQGDALGYGSLPLWGGRVPDHCTNGTNGISANGAAYRSLGQRPRFYAPSKSEAPTGRTTVARGIALGHQHHPIPKAPTGRTTVARGIVPGVPHPIPKAPTGRHIVARGIAPGVPHQIPKALKGRPNSRTREARS